MALQFALVVLLIPSQGHLEFLYPFRFTGRRNALKYLGAIRSNDINGILHAIQILDIDDGYCAGIVLYQELQTSTHVLIDRFNDFK